MPACLGDCLLKRQSRPGAVLGLIQAAEALAGVRDQALIALPFVQEHPEAEPTFLVLLIPQRRAAARASPRRRSAHAMPATQ